MRAVLQRVKRAAVSVDGAVGAEIGEGLLLFLGVGAEDTAEDLEWLVNKVGVVRVFEDDSGKMNRSVTDVGGEVLVISQFTLFGTLRKGCRPSFNRAGPPQMAQALYEQFISRLACEIGRAVPGGVFGAHMVIDAVNDGPVTLILDSRNRDF